MDFVDRILDISFWLTVVQMIPMLVMVWIGVIAACGLLKKRRKEPLVRSRETSFFGIIVCAHNEENAIGSLFESIAAQDYDRAHIHTFLLADRCTDHILIIQTGDVLHGSAGFLRLLDLIVALLQEGLLLCEARQMISSSKMRWSENYASGNGATMDILHMKMQRR